MSKDRAGRGYFDDAGQVTEPGELAILAAWTTAGVVIALVRLRWQ